MINLDIFLPYRLATLSQKLSASFAKIYADKYDLTVPQWRVIAHLAEQTDLTSKEICVRAGLDKSTASRAVKQLMSKQLIDTNIAPFDKRATVLCLSQQGVELYKKLSLDAEKWQNDLLSQLSDVEQNQVVDLLSKIDRLL
jgi:DNA-binding MarR family transcriptional regulator